MNFSTVSRLLSGQIYFDIPFYVFLLFAGIAGGLAYLMYRNIEGISKPRQILLAALRALSFFLLLLAVTNLVTDFVRFYSKKRDVVVLVDDSKSMSLNDRSTPRSQVVRDILKSQAYENLRKYFDVTPVVFGGGVLKNAGLDSLKYDQPATNIESALMDASKLSTNNKTVFAILLTDGDYNAGGNPVDVARGLSFPVYSIGIGDSAKPKDVVVKQVIPAPAIYAGKKSIVKAIVSSNGFGGKSVTAFLMEDGKEIDSKAVTLPDEGDLELSFGYTPKVMGTHVLTVYIPPQKGEFNQKNNSASVTADVQKGKFNVLLVAGEPAADVAFLRRNLEENGDFDLKVLIQKTGENFYEKNAGEMLSEKYDAVLLYDFPNSQSMGTFAAVAQLLNSTGVPFAYFAGENFSPTQVGKLPRLPFTVQSYQKGEFQVGISPVSSGALSANLQPLYTLLSANSSLFPPLYYQRIECKPVPGSIPLAFPILNGVRLNSPVLLASEANRSAAFLAYGLWRLQLMSSLSGLRSDFLQDFVSTLIRTLISGGKQKLLTVHTDKKVYDPSEAINFNSFLVDRSGSPVNDATVEVNINSASTRQSAADVQLTQTGDGGYSGSVSGLGGGKYSFVATAKSSSTFLGSDSGTIVVEPLNTEFIQTSMNVQFLRQLSSVTGGEFVTPSQFMQNGLNINPEWKEPVRLSDTRRFEFLSSLPILAIVFVLLSVEWIMRKIWGLP